MKNFAQILLFILALCSLNSCATIVSKSSYPLKITTNPEGVNLLIKDADGLEIFKGSSPATVKLKAGAGFFKRAAYTLTVSGDGFKEQILPINFKLDGWYFGNLLIGGILGMLIIDPATGAMYKLENQLMNVDLTQSTGLNNPALNIYDIADVPENLKDNLVRLNP